MIGRLSASTVLLRIVALVIAAMFALVIAFSAPGISEAKNGKGKNRHHHGNGKVVHKKQKKGFECSPSNVQVGGGSGDEETTTTTTVMAKTTSGGNHIDQNLQCFRTS
jgi:hypothetical protein